MHGSSLHNTLIVSLVLAAAHSVPAFGAENDISDAASDSIPDCVVKNSDGENAVGVPRADEFSDRLNRCGSVLEPKPVGDRELVLPPQEGGETPVIRPEALPPE
jgi:hypothetical protein